MRRPIRKIAAFSLVEVTLALGVSAFCLITIFGLLPVGMKSNQTAIEQTIANGILSVVAADLRAASQFSNISPQFSVPIPSNPVAAATRSTLYFTGDGELQTALNGPTINGERKPSRHQLTITFLPNGSNLKTATLAKLKVSWPAALDPDNAKDSAQTFLALDRN